MSSTTEVTTLESWKGKYNNAMESLDAHVDNKFYLPGGIALIVLAIALMALTAYGTYELYMKIGSLAIIPTPEIIVFGGGFYVFLAFLGIRMVHHAIQYQDPSNPTDPRSEDL